MNKCLLISCFLPVLFFYQSPAQNLESVIKVGVGNAGSNPYAFTVAAGKLFFVALESATTAGLYATEGTEATTTKVSPATIVGASFSSLVAFNGKLFFACDDGVHGKELWTSDGTAAGTGLFTDLYPGATASNPFGLTVMNNKLFLLARTPAGNSKMFVSDGTPGGTLLIRNQASYLFDNLPGFAILNNEVYFKGETTTGLWKSDGTAQGTVLVKGNITPSCPGGKYAVLAGKLYFNGYDNVYGGEPYVTDGTEAGTYVIKNIYPDQVNIKYGSGSRGFTVFNNSVYFAAVDGTHGEELYATDGTDAGTFLVKDITPGAIGSMPSQLIVFNGSLYISCQQSKQLWKSNGTEAGTVLVSYLNDRWIFGAIWNNQIYALPGTLGSYLYKTGGTAATTGAATAENVYSPILNYNIDGYLTVYNGSLYFGGSCTGVSDYREPLRLVPTVVTRNFSFTGSGNWSDPANWAGGNAPPSTLMHGDTVLISENCVLDISVQALAGSSITVAPGKKLLIQGALTIQ